VNGKYIRIWKAADVVYMKIMSQHLPGQTEETQGKPVRLFGDPFELRSGYLPNTSLLGHCGMDVLKSVRGFSYWTCKKEDTRTN
jgi:hypothetical protein